MIKHKGKANTDELRRTPARGDAISNYEPNLGMAERIAVAMAPKPQEPEHERQRKLKARVTIRRFSWE